MSPGSLNGNWKKGHKLLFKGPVLIGKSRDLQSIPALHHGSRLEMLWVEILCRKVYGVSTFTWFLPFSLAR